MLKKLLILSAAVAGLLAVAMALTFIYVILFDEAGNPVVIDVQAIGKGTRAFDLAVLYSRPGAYAHDPGLDRRLRAAADAVAGPEVFNVCLAAEIIGIAYFGLRHWPADVPALCQHRRLLFP